MPCISFIVPVYNMERLLPRALRSLRAQTLTDFEAILINDGSKDGSAALCAQAVAEDARFRFIDQPNGGVATARNAGLDAARGEYIFFLDPDDWVEPDAAEVLYHAARNADADCVEFGLYLDSYDENDRLLHTQTSGSTLSGVYRGAPFKEHFDETASSYLVTNKLFRRAFLEQHRLRFSCHQLGEDGLFFVAFYRQNPGCLVVLEKPLSRVYPEIDMVTTPTGKPTAMVHCNNCTNDMNAWAGVLRETAELFGSSVDTGELFTKLYRKSLEGEADCGGVMVVNYLAGEGVTHLDEGRPLVLRRPDSRFTLANFLRAQLYSTMATLKIGMDLLASEQVAIDSLTGHGGLFKTPGVGQKYMAAACGAPVTVMESAGEGGPYGMALLAAFVLQGGGETLEAFLAEHVFADAVRTTLQPDPADVEGFRTFLDQYKACLRVEQAATENL